MAHRCRGLEQYDDQIVTTQHPFSQLTKALLTKLAVLVGSRRALATAARTPGAGRRHTGLTRRLDPNP